MPQVAMETLFEELKRYVDWSDADERALRRLHASAAPHFARIVQAFYERILAHEGLHEGRVAVGKILDLELAIMLHTYREDLIAQQQQNERLATFGQLVGSIGHELRNPLGVIESSLYILGSRVGDDERANKHIGRIGE